MAGDWIKVENVTPDKPEVFQMAEQLNIDPDAVVGKLLRVWVWADQQTTDGNARGVTRLLLDRLTGVTGFADALLQVGWLKDDNGLEFVNFDRHNGNSAKKRAETNKRVTKHRKLKQECNAETVTKSVTREEKRREERDIGEVALPEKRKRFTPPTVEEVQTYCQEKNHNVNAMKFVNFYASKNWYVGKNKMTSWKSAVANWASNDSSGEPVQGWGL